MATVKTQMVREERWRETTRMMTLQTAGQPEVETHDIQGQTNKSTSMKRTHKSERQV